MPVGKETKVEAQVTHANNKNTISITRSNSKRTKIRILIAMCKLMH